MKKRLHCPWIPEFGTDNGFRGYLYHSAPVLKSHYPYFLSDILVVSYVLSSAEPVVSTRCCAYTAQAGVVQRQNGFSIPVRASSGRMIHLKRNQGYLSFWEHAKLADRPTTCDSAKCCTRIPLRPGRRPTQHPAHSLRIKCVANELRRSCSSSSSSSSLRGIPSSSPVDSTGSRDLPPRT